MKLMVHSPTAKDKRRYIEVEVDDELYNYLSRFQWRVSTTSKKYGAIMATIRGTGARQEFHIELGRTILGLCDGSNVETLGDKYDYRKNNLYVPVVGFSNKGHNSRKSVVFES